MRTAFVVQVSGIKYESFISDYIFFANRAYPDSSIIILYEKDLTKKTLKSLKYLQSIGCKYILKKIDFRSYLRMDETFYKKFIYRVRGVFKCCGRFLIDIPEFHEFDEIYIGDIDLFIMREEKNLFVQHRIHSNFIGAPYSDIVRKKVSFSYDIKRKIKDFFKFGFKYTSIMNVQPKNFTLKKMTGLRYIKVDDYFKAVKPYLNEYIDYFNKIFSKQIIKMNNGDYLTLASFDDQQIICALMNQAFGFVPLEANCDGIDVDNPDSFDYRPHHGIHIKLFYNLNKLNNRILKSSDYSNYLNQYTELIADSTYKKLSTFRFGLNKRLTKKMIKYLKKHNYKNVDL